MAIVISRTRSRANCKCGALIEYGPLDLRNGGGHDDFGDWDTPYTYINCPDCKREIKISLSQEREDYDL